jgi:hypothetical protein
VLRTALRLQSTVRLIEAAEHPMNITIDNSLGVANAQITNIWLRPLVGAYELLFSVKAVTGIPIASAGQRPRWFIILAAVASVGPETGSVVSLGTARPDRPQRIVQLTDRTNDVIIELKMTLSSHQVLAVEELCRDKPMRFELAVAGNGGQEGDPRLGGLYNTLQINVPRSQWLSLLREARVLDIVSIEVPLPAIDAPPHWRTSVEQLRQAQKMLLEGHYRECVMSCRNAIDGVIGTDKASIQQNVETLKKLAVKEVREAMQKQERELALFAAVRNYAHLAHHVGLDGAITQFTRDEARMALTLCATLLGFTFSAAGTQS